MSRASCRILALLLFAAFGALSFTRSMWRNHLMGKAAFLQHQAQRYDKTFATFSHPFSHYLGFVLVLAFGFAIYEAWVLLITRLFASRSNTA